MSTADPETVANGLDNVVLALGDHLDYAGILKLSANILRLAPRLNIDGLAVLVNLIEDITESLERSASST